MRTIGRERPAPEQYALRVTVEGEGAVDPAEGMFDQFDVVAATAEPDAGYAVAYWEGDVPAEYAEDNPLVIVMDADTNITAVFVAEYHLLGSVAGEGSVEPTEGVFAEGTEVTVTAEPADGHVFSHWEGDVPPENAEDNPLIIIMDADKVLVCVTEPDDSNSGYGYYSYSYTCFTTYDSLGRGTTTCY